MSKATLPPFSCTHTPEFPELLAELQCSLLVSTYQAGKVILIGSDGEQLSQLPRTFDTPMGTAYDGRRLAVATRHEVVQLVNEPRLAAGHKNSLLLVQPLGDRLLIAEHLRGKQEARGEGGGELLSLRFEVLSRLHEVELRVEEGLFSRGRGRTLGLGQLGEARVMPQTYALFHNYPNPFNPTTTLSFAIPPLAGQGLRSGGDLVIYNVLG